MGDIKNLEQKEALDKLKEIAEGTVCHFCSFTEAFSIESRPMHTQQVDDKGSLWFFSGKDSSLNAELGENNKVQLLYSRNSKNEYISIEGMALISKDAEKIEELWSGWAKTWFTEGKDDPNLTLIEVVPTSGYYWDTQHSKMISLIKIAAGAITGKTMDDGLEGKLSV